MVATRGQPHAAGRVGRRTGDDRLGEPQPRRLGQPPLGAVDLAQLAAQPDLAARDQIGRHRPAGRRRCHRQRHRQVGARLGDPHPTGDGHVHLGAPEIEPACRSSTASTWARRPPSTPWAVRRGDGALLGTTSACTSTSSGRCPSSTGATTEPGTPACRSARNSALGSGTPTRPALAHLEQAQLVGAAEPVLHRPQQAQRVVPLALEGEHRVDQVLEHPGAGEPAVLRDVAHQHDADVAALGLGHQAVGAPPHLAHRARRRGEVGVVHRLDRVDDHDRRRQVVDVGHDVRERRLGHEPQRGRGHPHALGPQRHLAGRLLGRDVQARGPVGGDGRQRLEQQRRLAHAGLAAQHRDRPRNEPAARAPGRARRRPSAPARWRRRSPRRWGWAPSAA